MYLHITGQRRMHVRPFGAGVSGCPAGYAFTEVSARKEGLCEYRRVRWKNGDRKNRLL